MLTPTLPVAFTGAPGAYSEEAARRLFGPTAPTLTCRDLAEALDAVRTRRASHAVVPVENSMTGYFPGVVESLTDRPDAWVVGELVLPIRHALLGVRGARLDELAVVTSHQSALAQCRDWLRRLDVATRPSADTVTPSARRSLRWAGKPPPERGLIRPLALSTRNQGSLEPLGRARSACPTCRACRGRPASFAIWP